MIRCIINDNVLSSLYKELSNLQNQMEELERRLNGKAFRNTIASIIQKEFLDKIHDTRNNEKKPKLLRHYAIELMETNKQHDTMHILDRLIDNAILKNMEDDSSDIYKRIRNIIHVLIKNRENGLN